MSRLEEIIEIVKNNERTSIDYLADYFKVTTMTIYNDLKKLGTKIIVSKSDVIYMESEENFYFSKQPHYFRLQRHKEEKKEIAKKAVNYIRDYDTVFLDGGSTIHYLAKEIVNKNVLNLTVVTYSPVIVLELAKKENIEIICLGGKLNKNNYIFFSNSRELLNQININQAFISAVGVSQETGYTELLEEEARLKIELSKYCKEIYILVDNSKFGIIGAYTFGPITFAKKIITDNRNEKIDLLNSIKNEIIIE